MVFHRGSCRRSCFRNWFCPDIRACGALAVTRIVLGFLNMLGLRRTSTLSGRGVSGDSSFIPLRPSSATFCKPDPIRRASTIESVAAWLIAVAIPITFPAVHRCMSYTITYEAPNIGTIPNSVSLLTTLKTGSISTWRFVLPGRPVRPRGLRLPVFRASPQ